MVVTILCIFRGRGGQRGASKDINRVGVPRCARRRRIASPDINGSRSHAQSTPSPPFSTTCAVRYRRAIYRRPLSLSLPCSDSNGPPAHSRVSSILLIDRTEPASPSYSSPATTHISLRAHHYHASFRHCCSTLSGDNPTTTTTTTIEVADSYGHNHSTSRTCNTMVAANGNSTNGAVANGNGVNGSTSGRCPSICFPPLFYSQ